LSAVIHGWGEKCHLCAWNKM